MRSFYEMILSIEYPGMQAKDISLRADYYAASSATHLVSKSTATIIQQFIVIRATESESISVTAVTNLVTTHEASHPSDKCTTVMYLPESCTRLDRQAYQATNVEELVLATSQLSVNNKGKSQSPFRKRNDRSGEEKNVF